MEKEKSKFLKLEKELEDLKEISKISDERMGKEIEEKLEILEKEINSFLRELFLSGKYDKSDAILQIIAGAGGKDSQDWATILLRMYQRYCQRKGFKTQILHQSFGEPGPEGRIGTKQVILEVKGNFAFGLLKGERGVHRLVRISPFSAKGLRHTSFALVEVLPKIPKLEKEKLKIREDDLKIEFFRASGPGGQYVNKKETAVRITHLPTGIQATCQTERFQQRNREKAMELLYSKLFRFFEEEKEKELAKIKGKKVSPSWGNQIRNY
ncbi:MAG: PCRF domain-containing protein, partial [Minisyncoccales bacterium]